MLIYKNNIIITKNVGVLKVKYHHIVLWYFSNFLINRGFISMGVGWELGGSWVGVGWELGGSWVG